MSIPSSTESIPQTQDARRLRAFLEHHMEYRRRRREDPGAKPNPEWNRLSAEIREHSIRRPIRARLQLDPDRDISGRSLDDCVQEVSLRLWASLKKNDLWCARPRNFGAALRTLVVRRKHGAIDIIRRLQTTRRQATIRENARTMGESAAMVAGTRDAEGDYTAKPTAGIDPSVQAVVPNPMGDSIAELVIDLNLDREALITKVQDEIRKAHPRMSTLEEACWAFGRTLEGYRTKEMVEDPACPVPGASENLLDQRVRRYRVHLANLIHKQRKAGSSESTFSEKELDYLANLLDCGARRATGKCQETREGASGVRGGVRCRTAQGKRETR